MLWFWVLHEPAEFNYDTISDVILQLRYMAREGGEAWFTEPPYYDW